MTEEAAGMTEEKRPEWQRRSGRNDNSLCVIPDVFSVIPACPPYFPPSVASYCGGRTYSGRRDGALAMA